MTVDLCSAMHCKLIVIVCTHSCSLSVAQFNTQLFFLFLSNVDCSASITGCKPWSSKAYNYTRKKKSGKYYDYTLGELTAAELGMLMRYFGTWKITWKNKKISTKVNVCYLTLCSNHGCTQCSKQSRSASLSSVLLSSAPLFSFYSWL